jgi:hypothetical protein
MHFWGQCLYINTSLRPRGFVEDPEKAKKIAEYEAKDNKGILNQIREKNRSYKKRQTDADKPAESDSIEIDAGDAPADQLTRGAYAVLSSSNSVFSSSFSPSFSSPFNDTHDYPLLHSWTLDPATDVHIRNNPLSSSGRHQQPTTTSS